MIKMQHKVKKKEKCTFRIKKRFIIKIEIKKIIKKTLILMRREKWLIT